MSLEAALFVTFGGIIGAFIGLEIADRVARWLFRRSCRKAGMDD